MTSVGMIDIQLIGNPEGVYLMLDHLEDVLGPLGLSLFLSGVVSTHIRKRAEDRFASEGDDAVGRWAPLAEATGRFRESYGYSPYNPINRRTGELEEYITGSASNVTTAPGFGELTFPGEPASGWLEEKVRTAQEGKEQPNTPARPILGLSVLDLEYVLGELALFIQGWRPAGVTE